LILGFQIQQQGFLLPFFLIGQTGLAGFGFFNGWGCDFFYRLLRGVLAVAQAELEKAD